MTYLPGIGLGEYLKYRKIWQSYNGPVTVQVLGIAGIDQVHSAQAHLILDNEVVQGSIPCEIDPNDGCFDTVYCSVGPFEEPGTYYLNFQIKLMSGAIIPAVVELPVVEEPVAT